MQAVVQILAALSLLACYQPCGQPNMEALSSGAEQALVEHWMALGLPYKDGCGFDQVHTSVSQHRFEQVCDGLRPACDPDAGNRPCYVGCSYTCTDDGTKVAFYLRGFESRHLMAHEWAHYMLACTAPDTYGDAGHTYSGVWTGPGNFVDTYAGPEK